MAQDNPHVAGDAHHQTNPRKAVWCAIHEKAVLGHSIPGRWSKGETIKLLNDVLQPYVDEIPLAVRRRFYFQQDGAPLNFAGEVRSWLDEILLGRLNGCREQIEWPPNPQTSRP